MNRTSSPIPSCVYPAISELIVVLTHNENKNFQKYAGAKLPPHKVVAYCNNDHTLNSAKDATFDALINLVKDSLLVTEPQLITFVIDFNFGYSGCNISPIPKLIAQLETEDHLAEIRNIHKSEHEKEKIWKYQLTQTEGEMQNAFDQRKTAMRFMLTGSGGCGSTSSASDMLINITPEDALNQFGFEGTNCIKYMFQCARAFSASTPSSSTRRIIDMQREHSGSTNSSRSSSDSSPKTPISTKSFSPLMEMSPIEVASPTLPATSASVSSNEASLSPQEVTSPSNIGSVDDLLRVLTLAPRQQETNSPQTPQRDSASPSTERKTESPNRLSPLQRPKAISTSPNSIARAKRMDLASADDMNLLTNTTLKR